ncbi:MAG: hypothetical protein ACXVLQ_13135 [Bacteriovorax sp.]
MSKTETNSFKGTKGEDDNAIHVITMLAVGFIGTKLLMYKKWTLDMSVVAAASALYIVSEIVNIMNLKTQLSDMNVQVTRSSDGKIDQTQVDTLQKLKDSYEKVKASVKKRKMLQLGAAAAFGGATAIAAYQRLTEDGQLAHCQAGITTAQAELVTCSTEKTAEAKAAEATCTVGVTCAAAVALEKEAADCQICGAALTDLAAGLATTKAKSEIPSPSMSQAATVAPLDTSDKAKVVAPCTGATSSGIKSSKVVPSCTTYLTNKELNKGFGSAFVEAAGNFNIPGLEKMLFTNTVNQVPKNMSIDPTLSQRNFLKKIMDTLFPRAEAGMMSMLGLGAGAAAAFAVTKLKMSQTIDTYMFTPGGRIIAWGVMTGAALLGAQASQKEIDKIDGYITKIDQMLKDLATLKSGIKSNDVSEQQIKLAAFQANQAQELQLNPNASVKTDCLTSMGSGNCTALSDQIKNMPGFVNLPESFKTIASQAATVGDGLSGTNSISASTLTAAGKLAGNQNAISKLAANTKNKLNENLAKNGKPKIDFNKEENNLLGQLKAQTAKVLSGRGMSPSAFLSSTGLGSLAGTSANAAIGATSGAGAKKASSSLGGAPSANGASAKNKDLAFDFKEAKDGAAGLAADGAPKEEKFDIGSNDINTNSGESIFQVISNRYIKSGYPKLLDEIPVNK